MNLKPFLRGFWTWTKHNSTKLLAVGAIIAEATGFYSMHREAPIVQKRLEELGPDAKMLEKVKVAGPVYLPAIIMFVLSSGCIVGGVAAGERNAAKLAILYSASEASAKRLEQKIIDEFGKDKAQEMHDKIANDLAKQTPQIPDEIEETGYGHELFFDPYTGRWFRSSIKAFEEANRKFNDYVQRNMWGTFNDWLEFQGRERGRCGDIVGWNIDHLLDCYTKGDERHRDRELYHVIVYVEEPRLYNGKLPKNFSDQDCCYID